MLSDEFTYFLHTDDWRDRCWGRIEKCMNPHEMRFHLRRKGRYMNITTQTPQKLKQKFLNGFLSYWI